MKVICWVLMLCLPVMVNAQFTNALTFQQGFEIFDAVTGPTGVTYLDGQDAEIREDLPDSNFDAGSEADPTVTLTVDSDDNNIEAGNQEAIGLFQFRNIFGNNAGQVPLGSSIFMASFNFTIDNLGNTSLLYQLNAPWSEDTVTFNSFGNPSDGLALGVDTVGSPIAIPETENDTGGPGDVTRIISVDVTTTVTAWANGDPNYGFALVSDPTGPRFGDGVDVIINEEITLDGSRPSLSIYFTPVPEPRTYALIAGLVVTGFVVWRRQGRLE